jgi:hypothetical protein
VNKVVLTCISALVGLLRKISSLCLCIRAWDQHISYKQVIRTLLLYCGLLGKV